MNERINQLKSERNELLQCLEDISLRFEVCCLAYKVPKTLQDKSAIDRCKAAIEKSFKSKAIGN